MKIEVCENGYYVEYVKVSFLGEAQLIKKVLTTKRDVLNEVRSYLTIRPEDEV